MRVNYVPSLMDQIKGRHAAPNGTPVTIRTARGFLPRVNPQTYAAMDEPQQFLMSERNGVRELKPLARFQWVEKPIVIEVGGVRFR